jgi:hypothetical protein
MKCRYVGGKYMHFMTANTDAVATLVAKKAADAVATKEATMKKTIAYVIAVKKTTDDAAARVAAENSAAKAAVAEKATEESAAQGATKMEVMRKAAKESVGSSSSPASEVRAKRAATSGSSNPSSKLFHCAWVPLYVEWFSRSFFLSVCTLFY